jgi:hypothetical protein
VRLSQSRGFKYRFCISAHDGFAILRSANRKKARHDRGRSETAVSFPVSVPSSQPGCPFGRSAYSAAKAYAIPLLPLVRRLLKRDWLLRLLYEFLKTRIAAQRVPEWMQTQLTVRKQTIVGQQVLELFKCKILFASPSVDDCEICKYRAARHRVFCNG